MEKKIKSHKTKSKISDGRKQLGSVRVIQKSLVYIVGLPLILADENLLQHRDYFGQYGRVLKVSISRTAAGSIQQYANNTCSVYITYSKEEEAIRCIQSVHGFILEDSPLRACFGTTKYCNAWLRNVPCSNLDCLYLHEIGTQEDSFTKDETVLAYTRGQEITGATSYMQPRSGNVLPPPADDWHNSSSTTSKSASNNLTTSSVNGPNNPTPNDSSGRSVSLPSAASWGARVSKGNPSASNITYSNGPSKQNPETSSGSTTVSTAIAAQVLHSPAETRKGLINNEESQCKPHKGGQGDPLKSSRSSRGYSCTDSLTVHEAPVHIQSPPSPKHNERCVSTSSIETTSMELVGRACNPSPGNDLNVFAQGNNDNLCSGSEAMNNKRLKANYSAGDRMPLETSLSANYSKFRRKSATTTRLYPGV